MLSRSFAQPPQKKQLDIFGFSEAPLSLRSNESSVKAIRGSYKQVQVLIPIKSMYMLKF
jgi:hypothetical protein